MATLILLIYVMFFYNNHWSHSPYHIAIEKTCTCCRSCRTGHSSDEAQYSAYKTTVWRCSRSIDWRRWTYNPQSKHEPF